MSARAMITVGDNLITMDILENRRMRDSKTLLTLADGSQMMVHPMDVTLYNSTSAQAMQMEEVLEPTYLPATGKVVGEPQLDRVIIKKHDKQAIVNVAGLRFVDDSYTIVTLEDGTQLTAHPKDTIFFDSRSNIMQQYQDRFINKQEKKENFDIDDYIFSM